MASLGTGSTSSTGCTRFFGGVLGRLGADIVQESTRLTMFACRERGRVAGVLLAAGAGTRFGMPKVLAEQGDWLRAAVDALGRRVDATTWWWSWAPRSSTCPPPARAVVAEDWATGMSASVRAGLAAVARCRSGGAAPRRHPRRRRRRRRARPRRRRVVGLGAGAGGLRRAARSPRRDRAAALGGAVGRRCAATRGRARFWRAAATWSPSSAVTWRPGVDVDQR